jgi:hypothetical protein
MMEWDFFFLDLKVTLNFCSIFPLKLEMNVCGHTVHIHNRYDVTFILVIAKYLSGTKDWYSDFLGGFTFKFLFFLSLSLFEYFFATL